MTCSTVPKAGFTCQSPWPHRPNACDWRPAVELHGEDRARLLSTIRACADVITKQKATIEALSLLSQWALGEGPLPCDEQAEEAYVWIRYAWLEAPPAGGDDVVARALRRVEKLLSRPVDDIPVKADSSRPWHEVIARLEKAAELRVALGRIKLATRRALDGDRLGTIRALRGAVDVFGEAKVSDYVRLQWRVADLEVELREQQTLQAAKIEAHIE